MKTLIGLIILASVNAFATGGGTTANSQTADHNYNEYIYKHLPLIFHHVKSGDNRLDVYFNLSCNQSLIDVSRTDIENNPDGKTHIIISALVLENPVIDCEGSSVIGPIDAGDAYSGRESLILTIE